MNAFHILKNILRNRFEVVATCLLSLTLGTIITDFAYGQNPSGESKSIQVKDRLGREVQLKVISSSGEVQQWYNTFWDQKGNQVGRMVRNADGQMQSFILREFRNDGQVAIETHYDNEGRLFQTHVHKYDLNGNWESEDLFNIEGHNCPVKFEPTLISCR